MTTLRLLAPRRRFAAALELLSPRRRFAAVLEFTCVGFVLALALPFAASAQQSGGGAEIEMGALHPSQVEMNAGARPTQHPRNESGTRIGLQARLDAVNMLGLAAPEIEDLNAPGVGRHLLVPLVTPGVRLIDGKLFAGLGFGFGGASNDNGPNSASRSGFSLSPLVSYDLLNDQVAALSLVGWLNFAHLGETENCNAGGCQNANDDATGWGASLAAGVRGFLSRGLALGGEFGWGFLDISRDGAPDGFVHSVFGNIFLEASVGI